MTEDMGLIRGSGNVFRDLGHANPDLEQLRAILAARIIGVLDDRALSVRKAHELTGIAAADFFAHPPSQPRTLHHRPPDDYSRAARSGRGGYSGDKAAPSCGRVADGVPTLSGSAASKVALLWTTSAVTPKGGLATNVSRSGEHTL